MMLVARLILLSVLGVSLGTAQTSYFPPPDTSGGWRTPESGDVAARAGEVDAAQLDRAFEYIQQHTKNGGLLVLRNGWLVYERYFGRAHRDATPNHGSVGKPFTSIAVGILMDERPELFPDGLDQKVMTERYFPAAMFPLSDPRRADIRLGQLLAMSAGIRGNNPGIIHGREVMLDPPGPDGWIAMVDEMAFGKMEGEHNTITLWCEPGGGYSYATSSIHLASAMLRHVTGKELEQYVRERLAEPMGWGRWGWGYKQQIQDHTPGGGGIAIRPTDLLRFGYMLLNGGRWQDRQLVPAAYVEHCGRPSPYNPHSGYSLQFSVNGRGQWENVPRDAYWKIGSGGFCLYMAPSLDLVVFKMGGRDGQFSPANTGLAPAPGAPEYDGSREGWRMSLDTEAEQRVYETTLEMVLAAIRE